MIRDQPDPTLRRVAVYLTDDAGDGVDGLTFSGAEIEIAPDIVGPWATSLGTCPEIGGSGLGAGGYYYQATLADAAQTFVLKIDKAGARPFIRVITVRSAAEESAEADIVRDAAGVLPVYLNDDAGEGVAGLTFSGAEIQYSANGAAWANSAGTCPSVGSGAYAFTAPSGETDERGFYMLKVNKTGALVYVYDASVEPAYAAGKSDATETAILKWLFQNIPFALVGDAIGARGSTVAGSLFFSLHTANPGEAGSQLTSEAAYPGYARVPVARSVLGFTVTGNSVSPAAAVTFGSPTSGTSETLTHFAVGVAMTGAGVILYSGALDVAIDTVVAVAPQLSEDTVITES